MSKLKGMIEKIVDHNIEVTIFKDRESGQIRYNLNVGFKSHTHLGENDNGTVYAYQRYNESNLIEDIEDLFHVYMSWFRDSEHRWGKGKMGDNWSSLWQSLGLLRVEKVVTENVTYNYN